MKESTMHQATRRTLLVWSAIHPMMKCATMFMPLNQDRGSAAARGVRPFHSIRGTKCTMTVV